MKGMKRRRSEHEEQSEFVALLRRRGIACCSVPNGASLSGDKVERARQMAKLKWEGLEPGAVDVLVFDPPPARMDLVGAAVEFKRTGWTPSDVSEEQRDFHTMLRRNGWAVAVADYAEAVVFFRRLGYKL